MRYHPLRKLKIVGVTAALTATLTGGLPAAASTQTSPWSDVPSAAAQRPPSVYFRDYSIAFPAAPQIINNTMMVPGESMLRSFGYTTSWDDKELKWTANHADKPSLVFWAGRHEALIGGKKADGLPAAPFMTGQTMWIPLRLSAEAIGMNVKWDPTYRVATVEDPNAPISFSVVAKASEGFPEPPLNLGTYYRDTLNANVKIELFPSEHYRDRVNVRIAAGEMGSLMLIENPLQYPDNLLASIAIDLTGKVDNYPRLKKLTEDRGRGIGINGKTYGIPLPQDPHDAPFPAVRQDWLDVLGLAQPTTLDEWYVVLERFTKDDPDGNGKHDTFGMTGYTTAVDLGSFAWVEQAYTGSPYRFSIQGGKAVDHAVSKEETSALKWLARAYADGLIDKEFPVLTHEQALKRLTENRAGAAALSLNEAANLTGGKAAWVPLPGMRADSLHAPIAPWNTQPAGTYIVSTMSKVKPDVLLEWLDRGIAMTESGEWDKIEGLEQADRAAIRSLFGQADLLKGGSAQAAPEPSRGAYEAAVTEWRKTSYEDTTIPGIAKVWSQGKYAEINSKLQEMKIKVILGAASIQDWEAYTNSLVSSEEYRGMMADLNALITK